MQSIIFDTLKYTKGAEKVGIPREHAEYQAQEIAKLITDELVTKSDLSGAVSDLKTEIHRTSVQMIFGLIGAMAAIQAIFHFIK